MVGRSGLSYTVFQMAMEASPGVYQQYLKISLKKIFKYFS